MSVTPNVAAATNPSTTLATSGLVFQANYGSAPLNCGAKDANGATLALPQNVLQVAPSTCTPFNLGSVVQINTGTTTTPTNVNVLSSQVLVYTAPGALVNGQGTVNPQVISLVMYGGAGCTGTVLATQNFVSSTSTCFGSFLAFYNSAASVSNSISVFTALQPIWPPSQQPSQTSALFQVNAFYSTLAACQAQTSTGLVQYEVTGNAQGTINTCTSNSNAAYAASTTSPTYFSNALCTTTTSATANNLAQVQFFTDSACATTAIGVNAYQAGVCVVTGAATSMNYVQTTVSGTTSLIQNTFTNNACTTVAASQSAAATPTQTTLASFTAATATTNCAIAPAWTGYSGYYMRYTQTTTLGTTLTGTANTGSANSVTWAAQYNTQAGCTASTPATGVVYQGAVATCLQYTQQSPTSTPTTPALLSAPFFQSQTVQGCSVPNPTAAPSFAPTAAPTGAPVAATPTSSSPACFAATEQVALENGASKAIADVDVGDRILTVNAKGEQVYSDVAYLPHGKNTDKAVFTVLATEAGRDVKMTANHMLPAGACDAAGSLPVVAASAVSAGDCVQTVSGRERVVSVSTVAGEGIYTAIAMEELLVVNGIVATPYGGVNPALANVYYNLHRLAYKVAGKALLAVQGATEGVWATLALLAASR